MTDAHDDRQANHGRPAKARRRWLSYSLRGLLVLVFLAALPAWWIRTQFDGFAAEQDAIARLRADGASIKTVPGEPAWFWKLLGKQTSEKCHRAVEANLTQVRDATDKHMELVGRLRRLETLYVGSRVLTDEDLRPCRALTGLRNLRLIGGLLTDRALDNFKGAAEMETLNLGSPAIKGIAVVDGFPKLSLLSFRETTVADSDMTRVGRLRLLRALSLPPTVTADGLRRLGALDQLKYLDLYITDDDGNAALEAFGSSAQIERLVIRGGALSDDGLLRIAKAPQLQFLEVYDAGRLTEEGVASLTTLPRLRYVQLHKCALDVTAVERLRRELTPVSLLVRSLPPFPNRQGFDLLRKRLGERTRAPR